MKDGNYHQKLFFWAAIWNFLAALPCWAGALLIRDQFFGWFALEVPDTLFPYHCLFSFVIAFGLGYLIVSRDVSKNEGLVIIGAIAKFFFFLMCVVTVVQGQANIFLLGIALVDLVFVILFIQFLRYRSTEVHTVF